MSHAKLESLKNIWKDVCKEDVEIEQISGAIYAFGSELACLRLLNYYYMNPRTKAAWSSNRNTWYFRLELQF